MMKKLIIPLLLLLVAVIAMPHATADTSHVVAITGDNEIVMVENPGFYIYEEPQPPVIDNTYNKYEMRGAWIATVSNTNMSKNLSREQFEKWANDLLYRLKQYKYNTVIFQVKPEADALYRSNLSPWSCYLTGTQGYDPGYDPLEIMTEMCHKNGIELHAWINPYRITMPSQTLNDLAPDNAAILHPEWVVKYGQQYYFNPGLPEVRQYLIDSVLEIVENYDVDAIHMDDYFYPYKIAGAVYPDADTYAAYGAGFATVEDFRRASVNQLVSNINQNIKQAKYWVQFGISPFGVYRNKSDDPTGSDTTAGTSNYDGLYADTREWIQAGSIDYIAPQVYWHRNFQAANYNVLLDWWNDELSLYGGAHPIHLYLGLGDYRVGSDQNWDEYEISKQIGNNRLKENVGGQMHYSIAKILENTKGYQDIVKESSYRHIALTPPTYWNHDSIPQKPESVYVSMQSDMTKISIYSSSDIVNKFVIYRFKAGGEMDFNKPENIIGVVYKRDDTYFYDVSREKGESYVYAVKSLSYTNMESIDTEIARTY